ncbi:formyl transferase [Xylaria sp. FL0933]|nr:formyl transferase [Xylaria sp. FL0933]
MNRLLGSLESTTRSLVLLCSPRSLNHTTPCHIAGYLIRHHHQYAAKRHQHEHKIPAALLHQGRRYSTIIKKKSDPLHILFCGSDDFSCASLQALHDERVRNPDLIRSINVLVRPGKPTGRGYKVVRDSPVRSLAQDLGLEIHERDSFTGWSMPSKINLIIAVSFGLFVPRRILLAAKYGGLNLHPSLLPDLRGPAPLQHALLAGRAATGVSLQTLDPSAYDHGVILAQTAPPLPIPPSCTTVAALQALVTPVATQMLIDGLRAGLHVPPHEAVNNFEREQDQAELTYAPKITKGDRQITVSILQARDSEVTEGGRVVTATLGTLARRQAAIGPLWFLSRDRQGRQKRIILEEIAKEPITTDLSLPSSLAPSHFGIPGMLAFTSDNHTNNSINKQSIEQGAKASHSVRQYRIPFEEKIENQQLDQQRQQGQQTPQQQIEQDANSPQQQQQPSMNLVFWEPDFFPLSSSSLSPSPASGPVEYDDDSLYLGHHRILSLKVEGEKAKPARQALHNFIINEKITM